MLQHSSFGIQLFCCSGNASMARGWIQYDDRCVGGFSVMIVVVAVTVVVVGTRRGTGIPWLGQQQQRRQGSLMFVFLCKSRRGGGGRGGVGSRRT